MKQPHDIGKLMHLYLDEIDPGEGTDTADFLIKATAQRLIATNGFNCVPVMVKETGRDRYQVIGPAFIYAVAVEAGLDRLWCIITDDSDETLELTQLLLKESMPKLNLSKASRAEIKAALEYAIEQPGSTLKSIKLATALNRIDEAPRQYWQTLAPITKLKCGITATKLSALEEIFYLTPEPEPKPEPKPKAPAKTKAAKPKAAAAAKPPAAENASTQNLNALTVGELRTMAKQRGLSLPSKTTKPKLIAALQQTAP